MTLEEPIEAVEVNLVKFAPEYLIRPDAPETFSLATRMDERHVPGLSVAVVQDNQIAWAKGYGVLKAGEERPVTPRSLFQACSVSKMVTAPLALRLIDAGVLDLDRNVNTYLKSWQVPDSELTREYKVTLRGLLSHQSGINRPDGGFDYEEGSVPTLLQILNGEAPAIVQAAHVAYVPGSRWQYANFGYIVIQQLLEDVLGRPFSQIAQETIFDPLELTDSTFDYPLSPAWARREISLHDNEGHPTHPGMIPSAVAHGGLITTASDLARFGIELMLAYQGQSQRLLTAGAVRQMFRQEVRVEDRSALGFPFSQGLGVFIVDEGDRRIIFHPGGNDPGASCLLCLLPDSGQGAVIMTNGIQGHPLTLEILSSIARVYQWL
jgi:CubicO group peptidase (beta-lactamase class C family)